MPLIPQPGAAVQQGPPIGDPSVLGGGAGGVFPQGPGIAPNIQPGQNLGLEPLPPIGPGSVAAAINDVIAQGQQQLGLRHEQERMALLAAMTAEADEAVAQLAAVIGPEAETLDQTLGPPEALAAPEDLDPTIGGAIDPLTGQAVGPPAPEGLPPEMLSGALGAGV